MQDEMNCIGRPGTQHVAWAWVGLGQSWGGLGQYAIIARLLYFGIFISLIYCFPEETFHLTFHFCLK